MNIRTRREHKRLLTGLFHRENEELLQDNLRFSSSVTYTLKLQMGRDWKITNLPIKLQDRAVRRDFRPKCSDQYFVQQFREPPGPRTPCQ